MCFFKVASHLNILPQIGNVMSLIVLLFFIYAALAVNFFSDVMLQDYLDEKNNFQSWPSSMIVLMKFSTGEDWNMFMYELANQDSKPIVIATLKGLLTNALRERVNYVNASIEAKERGIKVIETRDTSIKDFTGSLYVSAQGSLGEHSVTGIILGGTEVRITDVNQFPINVPPTKYMLFTLHRDMPGIIGKIGSLLGSFNVNIASMQVGRQIVRGDAVMVLSIDDPLPEGILGEITKVPGIRDAYTVAL